MQQKTEKTIGILIAEDHEIIRRGLKDVIDQQHDLEVIGETASCKETLMLASALDPCVILLNLTLSDGESLNEIVKLKEHCPNCKILLYTASADREAHLLALRNGAVGILLKSQSVELLCKAIRSVHLHNVIWIDNTLMVEMWKQNAYDDNALEAKKTSALPHSADRSSSLVTSFSLGTLTPREKQIACLSSKGLTAKNIGEKLFISEKTVRNQLTIIYSKLGVKNQLELSINGSLLNVCD